MKVSTGLILYTRQDPPMLSNSTREKQSEIQYSFLKCLFSGEIIDAESEFTRLNTGTQVHKAPTPSVNVWELMNGGFVLEFLHYFLKPHNQNLCGCTSQCVSVLRYETEADVDRVQRYEECECKG